MVRTRLIWSNQTGASLATSPAVRPIHTDASGSIHQATSFGSLMRLHGCGRMVRMSSRVVLGTTKE
jgi:hypothetical protein